MEVHPFFEIDCSSLKEQLRARCRLLATSFLRTLKASAISSCDACNDRYTYLDKRLRYMPVDSEELVEHRQFS